MEMFKIENLVFYINQLNVMDDDSLNILAGISNFITYIEYW